MYMIRVLVNKLYIHTEEYNELLNKCESANIENYQRYHCQGIHLLMHFVLKMCMSFVRVLCILKLLDSCMKNGKSGYVITSDC